MLWLGHSLIFCHLVSSPSLCVSEIATGQDLPNWKEQQELWRVFPWSHHPRAQSSAAFDIVAIPSSRHFFNPLCASVSSTTAVSPSRAHIQTFPKILRFCIFSLGDIFHFQASAYDYISVGSHCHTSSCLLDFSTCSSYYYLKLRISRVDFISPPKLFIFLFY